MASPMRSAISCRTACLIGGAANWLGAVSLGYGVSSTIQSGVAKVTDEDCWACGYCDSQVSVYALGMLAALFGGTFFMFMATHYAMPVSTTHAIVGGGIIGVTVTGAGGNCLNWNFKDGLAGIVSSWGTSPVLSGITGVLIYLGTHYTTMGSKNKVRNALWSVPILYGLSTFFVFFMIFLNAIATKNLHKGIMAGGSAACCFVVAGIAQLFLVPYIRDHLPSKTGRFLVEDEEDEELYRQHSLIEMPDINGDTVPTIVEAGGRLSASSIVSESDAHLFAEMDKLTEDEKDAMFVFRYLLVLVATLESFAHGANDTANSTGPVAAIFNVYDNGFDGYSNRETPVWIMAIAGCFVCLGIIFQGGPVMDTIGKRISHMDMHRGFAMELSSTVIVVIGTLFKLPVSTTHCQVGSMVFVSLVNPGWRKMSFPMMRKIVLSWLLTVPTAGAVAAFLTMIFRSYVRN